MRRIPLGFLVALVLCLPANAWAGSESYPSVVMISMDGTRPADLAAGRLPSLTGMAERGAIAERLLPSFPSNTFPNHVTLGLGDLAREVPVVLDPILFSSSGAPLLERRAWAALQALCGTCELVTPNLPEAEALSGRDVSRRAGVEDAARFFVEDLGAGAVLVKGGHQSEAGVADLLAVPDAQGALDFHWLESERIEIESVHGTGCALSSAITAHLAMGASLPEAVASARAFVAAAIEAARRPGDGAHFLVYS